MIKTIRNRFSGFTLIEALIGLVLIFVLGAIMFAALGALSSCGRADVSAVEAEAKTFAGKGGLKLQGSGASCVGMDTDGDGYVSCTLFLEGGRTMAIECAGHTWTGAWNKGCRIAQVKVSAPQQ